MSKEKRKKKFGDRRDAKKNPYAGNVKIMYLS